MKIFHNVKLFQYTTQNTKRVELMRFSMSFKSVLSSAMTGVYFIDAAGTTHHTHYHISIILFN